MHRRYSEVLLRNPEPRMDLNPLVETLNQRDTSVEDFEKHKSMPNANCYEKLLFRFFI